MQTCGQRSRALQACGKRVGRFTETQERTARHRGRPESREQDTRQRAVKQASVCDAEANGLGSERWAHNLLNGLVLDHTLGGVSRVRETMAQLPSEVVYIYMNGK